MTKYCPYCALEVQEINNVFGCSECKVMLDGIEWAAPVEEKGRRTDKCQDIFVVDAELGNRSLEELNLLNTYTLFVLLRRLREQRTQTYSLLLTFNNLVREKGDQMTDEERQKWVAQSDETAEEYKAWTRKVWRVENLLIDRIGYFPEAVTDLSVDRLQQKMEKAKHKLMTFRSNKSE